MTFTEIQASVNKTAVFTGSAIDVSGITGDWTIKLQVSTLTAAAKVRFQFEDTVTDWTASLVGPTFNLLGEYTVACDKVKSFKKANYPSLRLGSVSGQLRLKVTEITAASSVTYHAWIEY